MLGSTISRKGELSMNKPKSVSACIRQTLWQQPGLSLSSLLAVSAAIAIALLPPWLLGKTIDRLAAGEELPLLLILSYFITTALTGIAESLREGLLTVCGQKITHALRSALMRKYQRLETVVLTQQQPGTIAARFVGDADTVEKLFTSGIVSMLADACKILSLLAAIWLSNRGLALLLLALLPLLFAFTRCVQQRTLAAQLANRQAVGQASGYVPESIRNIRTIHCLGAEKYLGQRYDAAIEASFRAVERTNFYDAVYSPIILVINALTVASVMLLSASGDAQTLAFFGMSAGTAVAVINYISQIFAPIESLGMELQTIQSAVAGVRRIDEFFALPERAPAPASEATTANEAQPAVATADVTIAASTSDGTEDSMSEPNAPGAPYVEFKRVSFAYEGAGAPVLNDFSLQIRRGEQVTLAGRTGVGKSTLFKLLLGLYRPQSGSVTIDGRAVESISDQARRKLYGYVEQSFHPVPGTVAEQITLYDPAITQAAVRKAAAAVGLDELILQLPQGYATPCSPELFSQGQWQLLAIARATVADPQLLLLDEITANLDVKTEQEVLQALRRSAADRTVISISHRLNAQTGRVINLGDHCVAPKL